MSNIVLKVSKLYKEFGQFQAVKGISFEVPRGKTVGFLGPNGAGKTTTIHMLLGIITPTSGEISYFGKDMKSHSQEILGKINFTSAFNTLQYRITVFENLDVFARLYMVQNHKKKIYDLIEYFDSSEILHKRYGDLSSGQKTRVNIIKSLLNDPEIILMDEPTASLDPDVADKTLTLIETLKKERNLTLLYTSHNMDEITRICDEVIFLDHGKIVAQDTPLGLTKKIPEATLVLVFDGKKKDVENYLLEKKYKFHFSNESRVEITTTEKEIAGIIFAISKIGLWITDIEVHKPTLEDVFLQIARRIS